MNKRVGLEVKKIENQVGVDGQGMTTAQVKQMVILTPQEQSVYFMKSKGYNLEQISNQMNIRLTITVLR